MTPPAILRSLPVALLAAGLFLPQLSSADTFIVDSTADVGDPTPDGLCFEIVGGAPPSFEFGCPLRAAIDEANALAGLDTVLIRSGTYTLTKAGAAEDSNATGDLDILEELVIEGQGAVIIDAGGLDRVFDARPPPPSQTVTLRRLTLTGGDTAGSFGGCVFNRGNEMILEDVVITGCTGLGGGLASVQSRTRLRNSRVEGNVSTDEGGGLYLDAANHFIENSSITGNQAATDGGGIYATRRNTAEWVTLVNSTVSGNWANGHGGGVWTELDLLQLFNVTVSDNEADADASGSGDGGGLYLESLSFLQGIVQNSIVADNRDSSPAGNQREDCSGTFDSGGHNIVGIDEGCAGFTTPTDQTGTLASPLDPGLAPLVLGAGSRRYHDLLSSSPAVDLVEPSSCWSQVPGSAMTTLVDDQRGWVRPVDGDNNGSPRCDSGAIEYQIPIFVDGFESGDTTEWSAAVN